MTTHSRQTWMNKGSEGRSTKCRKRDPSDGLRIPPSLGLAKHFSLYIHSLNTTRVKVLKLPTSHPGKHVFVSASWSGSRAPLRHTPIFSFRPWRGRDSHSLLQFFDLSLPLYIYHSLSCLAFLYFLVLLPHCLDLQGIICVEWFQGQLLPSITPWNHFIESLNN